MLETKKYNLIPIAAEIKIHLLDSASISIWNKISLENHFKEFALQLSFKRKNIKEFIALWTFNIPDAKSNQNIQINKTIQPKQTRGDARKQQKKLCL